MPLTKETQHLAKDLIRFMQDKFGFDRIPHIRYVSDASNAKKILGMTGGYDPDNEQITIYIKDRHPKDVLRSLAHEMLHHVQKFEGDLGDHDMSSTRDPNYIMHDEYLKGIEADAFERGNITFREWEASKKGDKTMNESKKMAKSKVVKAHEKAKEAMPSFKSQYGAEKGEKIAYATMMKRAKKGELEEADSCAEEETVKENQEIKVNDALKNSHTYIPQDRPMADAYNSRDEKVYQELLKKFGIKK